MLETLIDWSRYGLAETIAVAALGGLLIGSFLNSVVHRLPKMLERDWQAQCDELAGRAPTAQPRFDLASPASHCPSCKAPIRVHHLVPVLAWLWLRGRCADCGSTIPWRYPATELLTAWCFAIVAWRFGPGWPLLAALVITACLLALALIDFDTHYLPDQLTLPLMWLGLLASLVPLGDLDARFAADPADAIVGAALGYLALWSVYWLFKLLTRKEGMGYGDFKLLAALGAWLGTSMLLPIVLAASVAGSVIGIVLILVFKHSRHQPIAFGPYLAVAGWLALLFGDQLR
jgi:leader peptidase (prepilin peptidase)/N-methyltransferase